MAVGLGCIRATYLVPSLRLDDGSATHSYWLVWDMNRVIWLQQVLAGLQSIHPFMRPQLVCAIICPECEHQVATGIRA